MLVFAVVPIATLVTPEHGAAYGAGMVVAGAATTQGGNFLGLMMIVPGFLILVVAAKDGLPLSPAVVIRLVVTAIVLIAGPSLALG